jgi:hypothetical protein
MWKRVIAIGSAIVMAPVIGMALLFVLVTVIPVFLFVLPMLATSSSSGAQLSFYVARPASRRTSSFIGHLPPTTA